MRTNTAFTGCQGTLRFTPLTTGACRVSLHLRDKDKLCPRPLKPPQNWSLHKIRGTTHGTRVVKAPWARSPYVRFTLGFEGYAMLLAQTMSLNEARRILRISRTAMLHIVVFWVNKAVKEDDLSTISRLSIDETSFKRGQSYVTVVGAPEQKRVIGVEKGRDVAAVERFSLDFEERKGDCSKIKYISSNAFAEGMNSMIQAAKRKARGYHTFEGYRTAIYLAVGKLSLSYPSPW